MGLNVRSGLFSAWQHLPRDARDTLFQLAVIGWTILPHAAHLAPWCMALAAVILLARARLAFSGSALPNRWTLWLGLLAFACATLLAFRHFPLPWLPGENFELPDASSTVYGVFFAFVPTNAAPSSQPVQS